MPREGGQYKLTVIQHNVNHSSPVHYAVLQQAFEYNTDVVLIQEPYVAQDKQRGDFICISHPTFHIIPSMPFQSDNRLAERPRTLAYIRKSSHLQFSPRYDLCKDSDMQIIELFLQPEPFLIINLYNEKQRPQLCSSAPVSSSLPDSPYTINRLLLPMRIKTPAILAGDFNLHHPRWNAAADPCKISKAQPLVNWLDENQAELLVDMQEINDHGGTLLRENLQGTSVIDLTFALNFRHMYWDNWHFLPPTGSDHEVIAFEALVPYTFSPLDPFDSFLPPSFNNKKADWNKLKRMIRRESKHIHVPQTITQRSMDILAESLVAAVTNAAESAIPRTRPCERSKPWWTEDLKHLRKLLHAALRIYKRSKTEPDLLAWKKARNTYFHAIRDAKTSHWEDFLANAVGKDVFTAAKYTRPAIQRKIPNIMTKDREACTFEEKCNAFLSTLFPPPPPEPSNSLAALNQTTISGPLQALSPLLPQPPSRQSPQRSTSSASKGGEGKVWPWPVLSVKEVQNAIKSSSAKKAPGPDRIGFEIIQQAYTATPSIFETVYSVLFNYGYHPRCWRKGIGIILPKSKKEDYSNPKAYRVITLLSCLGKVLEKIIATRLSFLANTSSLLHSTQLGSRKQRSAVDTALLLQHYVQEQRTKRKGNVTSVLFLDIKGAFDHVSKSKLLATMQQLQLPLSLINWVDSFLSERVIQLMFDGKIQDETRVDIGIPQGSPISPILFLIYTRDVWQDEAFQLSYMDDFSLAVSSTSARKNCKALERIAESLMKKAVARGVQFEPSKTELIHFHTRRKEETAGLTIDGYEVKPKRLVRWLGIWFDCKLSFKQHVEKRINLATASFFGLQRLGSLQKGLSFKALRQLYIACVTSMADFGVPIWYTNKRQGLLLNRYQRLQNMATRHMLGAFKRSPTKALELETALPPPEIRFEKQCNTYALRMLRFQNNHPIKTALNTLTEDELGDQAGKAVNIAYISDVNTQLLTLLQRVKSFVHSGWNIEELHADWQAPWTVFPAKFTISQSSKEHEATAHADLLDNINIFERESAMVYYTDGSQKNAATSAAVCRLGRQGGFDLAKSWNLGKGMEIADAEVFAVTKALSLAARNPSEDIHTVYIFVDSQAAISRLQNCQGNEMIRHAFTAAEELKNRGIDICIQWCPSHTGIPGNEMADILAKQGLEKPQGNYKAGTSFGHLRRLAKEQVTTLWRNKWQAQEEEEERNGRVTGLGRLYRQISRDSLSFSLRPKSSIINLPKNIISAYIQLKTGKGLLKAFQYQICKVPDNKCFCLAASKQDTRHLLLECKVYETERAKLKRLLKNIPLGLNVLLCTTKGQEALAWFLQETGICTVGWQHKTAELH